jgi:hypothetical protein
MCLVLANELSSKTKRRLVVADGFRRRKNNWMVSLSIPLSPSCCAARAEGANPRT